MNSRLETITERIVAAVRRLFGRPEHPSVIMQRKQQALARVQGEGWKAAQQRADGRWEDEGGSTGAIPSPLDKR